jgi:hypothetical protein
MTTLYFIIDLFCKVDDRMNEEEISKDSQASLYPSEIVTLGLLHAIKGVGNRPFYRWIVKDCLFLFLKLPERTRLFRLFKEHHEGIELIHPIREGRSPKQIGRKGISNHRWIVGGKLCLILNEFGLIVDWDCDTANVHDSTFQPLIKKYDEKMIVFGDGGFHSSDGDPSNFKLCHRGEWNNRMLIETVLSMLTLVNHFKKVMHRRWKYFKARLAFTMAAFNLLAQWDGLHADNNGFVRLSIAEFNL